jgi:hypothetical protein
MGQCALEILSLVANHAMRLHPNEQSCDTTSDRQRILS